MTHYVYILTCSDETLYVGATVDIKKRLVEHNGRKSGAHYTKIRRPVALSYVEEFKTLAKARAREAAIKRLTRAQKLKLIGSRAAGNISSRPA